VSFRKNKQRGVFFFHVLSRFLKSAERGQNVFPVNWQRSVFPDEKSVNRPRKMAFRFDSESVIRQRGADNGNVKKTNVVWHYDIRLFEVKTFGKLTFNLYEKNFEHQSEHLLYGFANRFGFNEKECYQVDCQYDKCG
jgi:hypothetical protein